MKKVLFIYYYFPPLLGDWRGLALAKLLPEFGWQPFIISVAESVNYAKDYSLLKQVPNNIEVHRVGHRERSGELLYISQKLKMNFIFPDIYRSWSSPSFQESKKILQKENIDLIFSSSPPYTAAFTARKLQKEFRIPWVAEWQDLWSGNDFLNLFYDKTLIKPLRQLQRSCIKRTEHNLLKSANKTIVVSWYHRQQVSNLYGLPEDKTDLITIGYDEAVFKDLKAQSLYPDNITITFLGSVYPEFLEPLKAFLKVVNEVNAEAEVIFIGRGSPALQEINLPHLTRILHLVREKALSFASGSNFLFLIMPPYANWIPSKIFEYLRLGKPILALVPLDSDPAKIIREAQAGFILSYDTEKMREQLTDIFNCCRQGKFQNFKPDPEYTGQFERRNLVRRLVDIFDELTT